MALALQAQKLGLHSHAMGGFDADKAFAVTGTNPDEYNAICAVAIGKLGDAGNLPEALKERESPSERTALSEIAFAG